MILEVLKLLNGWFSTGDKRYLAMSQLGVGGAPNISLIEEARNATKQLPIGQPLHKK